MAFDAGEPVIKTELMTRSAIGAIVAQRDRALAEMTEAAQAIKDAYDKASAARAAAGSATAGHSFHFRNQRGPCEHLNRLTLHDYDSEKSIEAFRQSLDASVWKRLLEETGLKLLMDRTEREKFDAQLYDDVPEIDAETIAATFERLYGDADLTFRRGIAKAFIKLDRRFKSHDGFKIGSRIILTRVFNEWGMWNYHSYARESLIDVERVFAILDGKEPNGSQLIAAIDDSRKNGSLNPHQSETETDYFLIRGFKNGNAHLWMKREDLVEKVNKQLADYYGAVMPDAATEDESGERFRERANVPAKKLQFYATPPAAAEKLLDEIYISPGQTRVLEPSAGQGALIKPLLDQGARVDAVEIDGDRCAVLRDMARAHGDLMTVTSANFLQMQPVAAYDYVVMNPPFYGQHYMKHVLHAFDFLKPGGQLRAILPASAEVNESPAHTDFRRFVEKHKSGWFGGFRALPPESFAESGTMIQTVILNLRK